MNGQPRLSSHEIAACVQRVSHPQPGVVHTVAEHAEWGRMEEVKWSGDHYQLVEYKSDLLTSFCVQYNEHSMLQSMNICLALEGNAKLVLKESGVRTGLDKGRHHAVYSPETAYDLTVSERLHIYHLAIDVQHYVALLCDRDPWMAPVKEKLQRREQVLSGDASVGQEMYQVVRTLRDNPLTGTLKKLFTEAKVLELMALQISQFSQAHTTVPEMKLKPADVDAFHALRRYLDQNFANDNSLQSLARKFGLNEFKLKKGFKSLFHTTVFDYIHDRRMDHARHLLRDEKKFVNEVAGAVGYKNPNHFSTAFKRRFGCSPTAAN